VAAPAAEYDLTMPEVEYTLNPQAGDASVSAELGGPGFTGEGWETNLTFPAIGQPGAPKGGSMTVYMPDWPATLRMIGKDSNTSFNYAVSGQAYMGLLDLHPTTLEYIPRLATHWKISEDKSTYTFRINPEARWSDGTPITAQDVIASWQIRVDETLLDPSANHTYSKLEEPKALSPYIVEVTVKEESWRNFLYFSVMSVFPAAEVGTITGEEYLDKYQFDYVAFSGPYEVKEENIVTGQAITVTRRDDWWAADNPAFSGMFNIDEFKHIVVKDINLAFEKLKKGELDYMAVPKAQWWAEVMPELDQVDRGLLVMRKFYNDDPIGTSGIAINMDRKPLDDVRVRKALQFLYDRPTMIEKLFFNEYEALNSYWQGGTYQNPDNEMIPYDEIAAVELLEAAGWTEVGDDGVRVKDGQRLSFNLSYRSALSERGLTVFQESAKRAGIELELQLLTPASGWKNMREKEYELMSTAWGAIIFPNPESSWHSRLADMVDNNNVTAFRSERVDELCDIYDTEYDVQKRIDIIREMDGIIYNEHPYILGWYGPAQRVAFWNKYDMPEWGIPRIGDPSNMHQIWWVNPELETQLTAAQADSTITMDAGAKENRFWAAYNEAQSQVPVAADVLVGLVDDVFEAAPVTESE
jgi:microcin C transport system substrate-binding protein